MRMKKLGEGGEGGGSGGQCAYLQLACGSDKHVYVVDLEVFLDEEVDPSHKFPRLIGEIFFNPSICKLGMNPKEKYRLSLHLIPPTFLFVIYLPTWFISVFDISCFSFFLAFVLSFSLSFFPPFLYQ